MRRWMAYWVVEGSYAETGRLPHAYHVSKLRCPTVNRPEFDAHRLLVCSLSLGCVCSVVDGLVFGRWDAAQAVSVCCLNTKDEAGSAGSTRPRVAPAISRMPRAVGSGLEGGGEGGVEDLGVAGSDGEVAAKRLGHDDAIEWVFVRPGESAGQDGIRRFDGQLVGAHVGDDVCPC